MRMYINMIFSHHPGK